MPPRGARPRLPSFLTFGGRVPASIGAILIATGVVTVYTWLDRGSAGLFALWPAAIVSGEVWRLASWAFVQGDPFGLLFVGFMFWWLAPQLLYGWGERRFLLRTLGMTLGAGLATTLVALVWPAAGAPHLGAWPVVNALLVSWAMRHPDAQVNIWGVLPVTGRTLALLVVGGTVLYALFGGPGAFIPHFAAMGIAYALSRGLGAGQVFRQAQEGWRESAKRRRARHLKVVKKDGKDDKPTWMN